MKFQKTYTDPQWVRKQIGVRAGGEAGRRDRKGAARGRFQGDACRSPFDAADGFPCTVCPYTYMCVCIQVHIYKMSKPKKKSQNFIESFNGVLFLKAFYFTFIFGCTVWSAGPSVPQPGTASGPWQ